jgi:hypothetical protein
MSCVNAAGEIVTFEIPWLQEAIDREKGLARSKAASRRRWHAPQYELEYRVPRPDVLDDEWRWSIKITNHNGSVEWIDDYYEKADAEREITRLRDNFDAHRHEEFSRGGRENRGLTSGFPDSSYKGERNGRIDNPWDQEWN